MNHCSNCGHQGEDVTHPLPIPNFAWNTDRTQRFVCADRPACRLRELARIKEEAAKRVISVSPPL